MLLSHSVYSFLLTTSKVEVKKMPTHTHTHNPNPAKENLDLQISQYPKLDPVLRSSYNMMGSDPRYCSGYALLERKSSSSGAIDLDNSQGSWTATGSEDSYN